ncbi:MAG: hypothetical protein K2O54_07305, partial [Prevotella sp.]|nr:hypothetical protein [Prevotella sp.]
PALELEDGKSYTLSFKVAPYEGDGTRLAIAVTTGDALIVDDAAADSEPSQTVTMDMESGKWNECSLTLTGTGKCNLRFRGATGPVKRFFLDEVLLVEKIPTGITELPVMSPAQRNNTIYNLSGQRVGNDWKGIRIVNGKKIIK